MLMPDGFFSILAIIGLLLAAGAFVGLLDRRNFSPVWLLAGAGLIVANDIMLTGGYGLLPAFGEWNWTGKVLAFLLSLAIAAMPAFGFAQSGLTFRQSPDGRRATAITVLVILALFTAIALASPDETAGSETIVFQATMPGLEEEVFYRGILACSLGMAFRAKVRLFGIDMHWGLLFATLAFGMAHAFSYENGVFDFDMMSMAITAIPALALVWVRERTGSVVLPILLHNYANLAPLLI